MRILVALCLLATGQVALAGPLQDAEALIARGDAVRALEMLEPLARDGDPSAAFLAGRIRIDGIGIAQDPAEGARLLLVAAEAGHAGAQNLLGRLYAEGLGVTRDLSAAREWMMRAAEQGMDDHQYDLAMLLSDARYGIDDAAASIRWLEAAAAQGLVAATTSLGLAYQSGTGVEKDAARAADLFETAAAAGDARAQNNLGLMLARGEGVPQDYARAARLFQEAAEKGQKQAFYNLGVMYENGFGVPLDETRARDLYAKAGLAGGSVAAQQASKAELIFDPRLQPVDPATVNPEDFEHAAAAGDPVAMFLAGYLLASSAQNADGRSRRAADWMRRAAERGLPAAMANYGLLHLRGAGVPQDYVTGYAWLALAAEAGFREATEARDSIAVELTQAQRDEAKLIMETVRAQRAP